MEQSERYSKYRIMWLFVFFDMPTETKKQRKIYAGFRKKLLDDGFTMFQFSIYMRHCTSAENCDAHIDRVKSFLPPEGMVGILSITDKQFGNMTIFHGKEKQTLNPPVQQLELF